MSAGQKFSDKTYEEAQETAAESWLRLLNMYRPWDKTDKEDIEKQEAQQLVSTWEAKFGSLSDPDVAKKVDQVAQAMMDMAKQQPAVTRAAQSSTVFNAAAQHLL
jgi:hypothetical protein